MTRRTRRGSRCTPSARRRSVSDVSSRYPRSAAWTSRAVRSCSPGHPPLHTRSAMSRVSILDSPARTRLPSRMARSETSPLLYPISASVIGRIRRRRMRPAPLCRVESSGGTADPARMKLPALPPLASTARRTWPQTPGTNCHSSINRGRSPSTMSAGSMMPAARAAASLSRLTSLAADRLAVSVFPQARGPSIRTAPPAASRARNSSSATRGR
jgi:hypothetical protein